MANENIDRTIEAAEAILAQFEIVRRVRTCSRPLSSVRECSCSERLNPLRVAAVF